MSTAFITSLDNGVAELVINKPPVNALDSHEWQALADTINALGADLQTRVIVIRAEGRGFCAGVDIKELDQHPELIVKVNRGNYETFKAVHRCPVPVIVAVHGFVLGAASASLARPISWWRPNARPSPCRKWIAAPWAAAHLQRLFPVQKVRYLFFTGEKIGAREAERYGFIERVVPREQLREATLEIADKIAAKSAAMIRIAKEALNGIEDGNLEDKYRWEQGFTLQAYNEADSAETRRAFVEKRDAKF